jgi:hypothetical protein
VAWSSCCWMLISDCYWRYDLEIRINRIRKQKEVDLTHVRHATRYSMVLQRDQMMSYLVPSSLSTTSHDETVGSGDLTIV